MMLITRFVYLLVASVIAFPVYSSAAEGRRPNVLLICVDDLKPLLGCYGDTIVKSPHLDRLAVRGMVFESAYCNQAVCAPSRNALMTGLRSTTLGIYDLGTNFRRAAPDAVTVAQHFKQQGYRTESLGKIMHSGHGNQEDAASWSVPHWRPSGGGNYALPINRAPSPARCWAPSAGLRGPPVDNANAEDDACPDGKIVLAALNRLRAAKAKPDTPFFLSVGFLK